MMEKMKEQLIRLQQYAEPTYYLEGKKGKKYPYFKYFQYKERMEEVFGPCGYHTEYSTLEYLKMASGQEILTCRCRITILDEEGKPVLYREGLGNVELYYGDSGKEATSRNISNICQKTAFKSACQEFGIFGIGLRQQEQKPSGVSSGTSSSASSSRPPENQKETLEKYCSLTSLEVVRTDKNTGLDVYRCTAYEMDPETGQSSGAPCHIVFYPNHLKEEHQRNYLKTNVGKKTVKAMIRLQDLGNREGIPQYSFLSFPKA